MKIRREPAPLCAGTHNITQWGEERERGREV